MNDISRRFAMQTLALTPAMAGAREAIEARKVNAEQPASAESNTTAPKVFDAHQYAMLRSICDSIIPADETSGGALDAAVPELIDLLASENQDYQTRLTGGLQWLDGACSDRYGRDYLQCSAEQRNEMLQLIAYRENATQSPPLTSGIAFFTFLRDLTLGGYFTSKIGMNSLPYLGNQFVAVFPACPPLPQS
jgi:gluconate 2-dehydrogenase gamma chain